MASVLKILYYNIFKINRFIIFEFDLTQEFPGPTLDPCMFKVIVMDGKELDKLTYGKQNLPRECHMHELDGVNYCVVITTKDRIAHISWIYLKGDKNKWFNLTDNESHLNYSYTFPEYRGKGLHSQAVLAAAKWLRARGYRRILMDAHEGTIYVLNSARKIRAIQRVGVLSHWFFYRPKFRRRHPVDNEIPG